jgi:hypothetical protein
MRFVAVRHEWTFLEYFSIVGGLLDPAFTLPTARLLAHPIPDYIICIG